MPGRAIPSVAGHVEEHDAPARQRPSGDPVADAVAAVPAGRARPVAMASLRPGEPADDHFPRPAWQPPDQQGLHPGVGPGQVAGLRAAGEQRVPAHGSDRAGLAACHCRIRMPLRIAAMCLANLALPSSGSGDNYRVTDLAHDMRHPPIRATSVKRTYEPGPVTMRAAGLG
jgi:hypothetical protein